MPTDRQMWALRLAAAELTIKSKLMDLEAEAEKSQIAGEIQSYANDLDAASRVLREMLAEGLPSPAAK